jgi:hypothetical protein
MQYPQTQRTPPAMLLNIRRLYSGGMSSMSSNRSVDPTTLAGDPFAAQPDHHDDELLRAAAAAMRLLQDRQAHTPEGMLDGRERRVLRELRDAVRSTS